MLAVAGFACGAPNQGASDSSEQIGTSHAALCAGEPEVQGDYVTLIGCPFEQQAYNIVKYGTALAPTMSFDSTGAAVATVTASCDSWWLGQDPSGLDVILDSETGEVISHGSVHPGLPVSALPGQMPAPFALSE